VLQKLLAHQSDPVPDVRELRPDVPDALAGVLGAMLSKRPEDRFQTPADLTAAMLACAEEMGLGPSQQAVLPAYWTTWVPPSTWWRGNVTWLAPAVLLIGAVLALAVKWRSEAPEPVFTELQIPATVEQDKKAEEQGDRDNGTTGGKSLPR
jgi:serine/threonine-protein kinase